MAFKHISLLWSAKSVLVGHVGDTAFLPGRYPISPGHVGDTAFLPGQKTHITTFGALTGLAFDNAYRYQIGKLVRKKNVW